MLYLQYEVQSVSRISSFQVQLRISLSNIPARLMYQLDANNQLVLVWELSIQEITQQDWWNTRVDAITGTIVDKNNYMAACSMVHDHSKMDHVVMVGPLNKVDTPITDIIETPLTNTEMFTVANEEDALVGSYNVYPIPVESPNHGARSLEADPDNAAASPFGWHDTDGAAGAESTLTTGNNVDAHKGSDRPDGTASLIFDFAINTAWAVPQGLTRSGEISKPSGIVFTP